jgi:hypothetical protein
VTTDNAGEDGCVLFTYTLSNNGQTLDKGATLQYKENDNANPKTVFTTGEDITINGTQFDIGSPTVGRFHIPSKGLFPGGAYNSVTNVVFDTSTDQISGTFQHLQQEDPDCSWDASTSGFPKPAKRTAGY